tara:strand:- start:89 stop:202 length:114 start_codon:yes stop_codon:yes gene_type:complete
MQHGKPPIRFAALRIRDSFRCLGRNFLRRINDKAFDL